MRLYIKNMVCNRCKMVVRSLLNDHGYVPLALELGEVDIKEELSKPQMTQLDVELKSIGFELMDNKKSKLIEKIKKVIIHRIHHSDQHTKTILSEDIASAAHHDYNYLSNLFSEIEGISIEKYFILQRIEKAKELLMYDELTLSQIADRLGYSSTAYLSNQFKKITGSTPSFFKALKEHKRQNIEDL